MSDQTKQPTTAPAVACIDLLAGVELIKAERQRQIEKEGWTPQHDDAHTDGALVDAAAAYISQAGGHNWSGDVPHEWPWEAEGWRPTTPLRDLVKAGALIAAEIDRLLRLEAKPANDKVSYHADNAGGAHGKDTNDK